MVVRAGRTRTAEEITTMPLGVWLLVLTVTAKLSQFKMNHDQRRGRKQKRHVQRADLYAFPGSYAYFGSLTGCYARGDEGVRYDGVYWTKIWDVVFVRWSLIVTACHRSYPVRGRALVVIDHHRTSRMSIDHHACNVHFSVIYAHQWSTIATYAIPAQSIRSNATAALLNGAHRWAPLSAVVVHRPRCLVKGCRWYKY